MMMKIRFATLEDAAAILDIYAYYVEHTEITFEYEVCSLREFQERMKEIMAFYPYLVVEEENQIIGYAYAHRLFQRKAYDWDVELSQYFHHEHTSKGYGSILFQSMIQILQMQGIRNAYSLITLPNDKSEGLHHKYGFEKCGVYHKSGYKHSKWLDVGIYEKNLMPYGTPSKVLSIHDLDQTLVKKMLSDLS